MSNYAIGCFYKFENCAIAKAEIINYKERKVRLFFEAYTNKSIKFVSRRLKSVGGSRHIWLKKHDSLMKAVSKSVNQISFKDEESLEELDDIYKSMISDKVIDLNEIADKFDSKLPHHVYALQLSLKGLDYYQPSYDDILEN